MLFVFVHVENEKNDFPLQSRETVTNANKGIESHFGIGKNENMNLRITVKTSHAFII